MDEKLKALRLAEAVARLGRDDSTARQVLGQLWDEAHELGRLDALDELTPRLCVCMK